MIGDRGVDAIAHGRQEGHQPAKAIALNGDLSRAVGQLGHNAGGILDVPGAGVSVIGLIEAKAVAPVGLGSDAEVDALLLTPEEVGRHRDEAQLREDIAVLADIGVDPEQLLQNNDS